MPAGDGKIDSERVTGRGGEDEGSFIQPKLKFKSKGKSRKGKMKTQVQDSGDS